VRQGGGEQTPGRGEAGGEEKTIEAGYDGREGNMSGGQFVAVAQM